MNRLAAIVALVLALPLAAQPPGNWLQQPDGRSAVPARTVRDAVPFLYDQQTGACGSGTNIDPAGLVITAAHVTRGRSTLMVRFPDGRRYTGQVVASDPQKDLSAVSFPADPDTPWTAIAAAEPAQGEALWLIGYPGGRGQAPTVREGRSWGAFGRMFRVSAPAWPGDSGGGVFTSAGGLAAVLTSGDLPVQQGGGRGGDHGVCVPFNDLSEFCLRWRTRVVVRPGASQPTSPIAVTTTAPAPPPSATPPSSPSACPAPDTSAMAALASSLAETRKDIADLKSLVDQLAKRQAAPGPAGPPGAKGDQGAEGKPGPAGPPGRDADVAAVRALLAKEGFTVEVLDEQNRVVQRQSVTLGGTLRLRLEPVAPAKPK